MTAIRKKKSRLKKHIRSGAFYVMVCLSTFSAFSCLHYPHFSFGGIQTSQQCVAVLPVVQLNDTFESDDLLGQFLAQSLISEGFSSALTPKDIEEMFESVGLKQPQISTQREAIKLGKALGADAVLYGTMSLYPLVGKSATTNPGLMMGVDLYLVGVGDSAIFWTYATNFYSSVSGKYEDLAKLSDDLSRSLLLSSSRQTEPSGTCWNKQVMAQVLKQTYQGSLVTPTVAAKPKIQSETSKEKEIKKEATKLSSLAESYRTLLKNKKPVVLRGFFDGRSTQIRDSIATKTTDLAAAMASFPPETSFDIEGHVDATDDSSSDFWVSAQQAGKLREQLIDDEPELKNRIKITARGGASPLVPNINRKSRQRNHRLEIHLSGPASP